MELPGQLAMLFANDLVLCNTHRDRMEAKMKRWRETDSLENNGLIDSRENRT